MPIHIATPDDIPALTAMAVAFRNHLARVTPTDADFRHSIERLLHAEDAEFFMAKADDQPIGYLLMRLRHSMWANGQEATVEDLFVDPRVRQQGTGRALVAFALDRAAARGCTTACLDTNEFNVASTRIYTSLGFDAVSRRWNGRQIFYRKNLSPL